MPNPSYRMLVIRAIKELSKRGGSSRQAIKSWILANYDVNQDTCGTFISRAIKKMVDEGELVQNKQSFRLSAKVKARKS